MPKVEKLSEATFHPYAECADDDCGWQRPPDRLTRDFAKYHARDNGHRVRVITEKVALWGPRDA